MVAYVRACVPILISIIKSIIVCHKRYRFFILGVNIREFYLYYKYNCDVSTYTSQIDRHAEHSMQTFYAYFVMQLEQHKITNHFNKF